jgi:tagaturonate reductase
VPTLDLPRDELLAFADSTSARFSNPYIKHKLLDIALNSCSKFETRCLPSILDYQDRFGKAPTYLTFAFAAFIAFYRVEEENGQYRGARGTGDRYGVRDDTTVLRFFADIWTKKDARAIVGAALSNTSLWRGKDLTRIPGLADAVAAHLDRIMKLGARKAVELLISENPYTKINER